ncbi:MAG: hypothetical protein LBC80_02485, partial [Treponema sp.]|nr:hypothetical protein [Treponema sp.]
MKKLTVFIIALVFLFAACTNPSSNTPTVNSISITSPNESLTNNEVTLFLGENIELTAIVDVSYEASTAVEWSVTGWSYPELGEDEPETAELEAGTGVSPEDENTTTLTINENEKADFLIVTATSVFNPDKFESVKVHIDHTVTEITGVTIEPNEDVSVFIFGELQFTATVEGTGRLSQTVTWTIDEAGENGKTTAGTEIDDDGLLTVSGTEELEELTIRATSVGPEHKWASVKVTIKTPKVSSLTIFTKPLGLENVDQGGSIEFDFNLVFEEYGFPPEISEDVTWLVVRENNQDTAAGTKFRENTSILDVDEEEALGRLIITATSVYDTSKVSAPINLTVREISPIHIVNSVKIINIPKDVEVLKGATHQFTHLVDASGPLPLPPNIGFVNWNLTGNTSITTTIVNGLLTVAPDEEGPILAITVTSTFEGDGGGLSDTATVTIPAKRTLPNPDAVMLNNQGVATWTASSPETFVEKYILQLYKGAEPVGDKTEVNKGQNYSVPFISEMRKGAGTYTFKITAATTDTINFDDSAEVESNSQTVRQRTPADNLSWDGDKATWSAGGGDIIGGNFRVKLY